jgi:hypothetical protein
VLGKASFFIDLALSLQMVFVHFDSGSSWMYLLLVIDNTLLIMRDADLYDDIAKYLTQKIGGHASVLLPILAAATGQHDVLADIVGKKAAGFTQDSEEARVKDAALKTWTRKETLKQSSQSEVLATTILITIVCSKCVFVCVCLRECMEYAYGGRYSFTLPPIQGYRRDISPSPHPNHLH